MICVDQRRASVDAFPPSSLSRIWSGAVIMTVARSVSCFLFPTWWSVGLVVLAVFSGKGRRRAERRGFPEGVAVRGCERTFLERD